MKISERHQFSSTYSTSRQRQYIQLWSWELDSASPWHLLLSWNHRIRGTSLSLRWCKKERFRNLRWKIRQRYQRSSHKLQWASKPLHQRNPWYLTTLSLYSLEPMQRSWGCCLSISWYPVHQTTTISSTHTSSIRILHADPWSQSLRHTAALMPIGWRSSINCSASNSSSSIAEVCWVVCTAVVIVKVWVLLVDGICRCE